MWRHGGYGWVRWCGGLLRFRRGRALRAFGAGGVRALRTTVGRNTAPAPTDDKL